MSSVLLHKVTERNNVAQSIPKSPLTMTASIAGEERRLGLAESSCFEPSLYIRMFDPSLRVKSKRCI